MKYCKDCKYHIRYFYDGCCRKKVSFVSLLDGVEYVQLNIRYCEEERKAWFFGCGKKAKYFEDKK